MVTAPAASKGGGVAVPGSNVYQQSAGAYNAALQGTGAAMYQTPSTVRPSYSQHVAPIHYQGVEGATYNPVANAGTTQVGTHGVATQGYNPAMMQVHQASAGGYDPSMAYGAEGYEAAQAQAEGYRALLAQGVPADIAAQQVRAGQLAGTDLSPYMNPFQSQVIDQSISQLDRARQLAQQQNAARAAGAGAFGGSRHGVVEAETNRGFADQVGSMTAQLNAANFGQAQQAALSDIGNRMQADLANQGANLQAGQFNASKGLQVALANQAAGNDAQAFSANARNAASLANAGFNNDARAFGATARNTERLANQAAVNAARAFSADAFNNLSQFNTTARNAGSQFNATAANQALAFGADAFNTGALADASNALQASQANAGNTLQASLANMAAQNAAQQFNAGSINDARQTNAANSLTTEQFNAGQRQQNNQFNSNLGMQGQLANQDAQLQALAQHLGAANQMGQLANLGFGMGNQIQQQQWQQGSQQQAMMQALMDASRAQFAGYSGAPNQSLAAMLAALGGANMGQQTQTTSQKPGLLNYLSLGLGLL